MRLSRWLTAQAGKLPRHLTIDGKFVSADALHCQNDTARTVLEQGGDYVLQVKSNRPALVKQCKELSKARELVGSFKKKN